MAEQMYFIIRNSDGDTRVQRVTQTELEKRLTVEDGAHWYGTGGFMSIEDLEEKGYDTNYWGNNLLIIKGEVVVPHPVETVVQWAV